MPKQLGNVKVYELPEIEAAFEVTVRALRFYCKQGRIKARKMGSRWFVEEEALREFFHTGNNPQAGAGTGAAA